MTKWKGIVGKGFRAQDFADYAAQLVFGEWRPQFVVVHNTAVPKLAQWHSHPGEERMRNLEAYYRDQKGWSAGPHLFIADDLIWVFSPLTGPGVHSPSWNGVSWGIEMVGDYSTEALNAGVIANTVDALAILHRLRALDPTTLRFHKEDEKTTHKTCPGAHVVKSDLIARVVERMAVDVVGEHVPGDDYLGGAAASAATVLDPSPSKVTLKIWSDVPAGSTLEVKVDEVTVANDADFAAHADVYAGTTPVEKWTRPELVQGTSYVTSNASFHEARVKVMFNGGKKAKARITATVKDPNGKKLPGTFSWDVEGKSPDLYLAILSMVAP